MRWSDKDLGFLIKNFQTMTPGKIAEELNKTEDAILKKMSQLDLEPGAIQLDRLQSRYISQNYEDLTVEELAEDLGLEVDIVLQAIQSMKQSNVAKTQPRPRGKIDSLIARQKENGVAVMTREASQASDGNSSIRPKKHTTDNKNIHIIKEGE